eukprot:3396254-Rhodomonas_salina.1
MCVVVYNGVVVTYMEEQESTMDLDLLDRKGKYSNGYSPTRILRDGQYSHALRCCLGSYAPPIHCPAVLLPASATGRSLRGRSLMVPGRSYPLPLPCAMSGTNIANGPLFLRVCYAMPGTNIAFGPVAVHPPCAMSCSNIAYPYALAVRCSVGYLPTRLLRDARYLTLRVPTRSLCVPGTDIAVGGTSAVGSGHNALTTLMHEVCCEIALNSLAAVSMCGTDMGNATRLIA